MLQSITNDRLNDNILNSAKVTDNNKEKSLEPGHKEEPISIAKDVELRLWAVLGNGRFVALEKLMGIAFNVHIRQGRRSWDLHEVRLQVILFISA